MAGLYDEQFSAGQTFVHEIRSTGTDIDDILFSSLTRHLAAVHIDHDESLIECTFSNFARQCRIAAFRYRGWTGRAPM